MNILSKEALEEIGDLSEQKKFSQFPSMVIHVRFWHPGGSKRSSDASVSIDNPLRVFGTVQNGVD